jgi:hypothetical protein
VTDIYLGGTLLAYFDTTAREFFCSYAPIGPQMVNDRQLVMNRTVDFTGVSPKMEFSTYVSILPVTAITNLLSSPEDRPHLNSHSLGGQRCRSPEFHSRFISPNYERQTSRKSRSVSPIRRDTFLEDDYNLPKERLHMLETPFVVRRVEDDLLSFRKTPSAGKSIRQGRSRSTSPEKSTRRGRSPSPRPAKEDVFAYTVKHRVNERLSRSRPASPIPVAPSHWWRRNVEHHHEYDNAGAGAGTRYFSPTRYYIDSALNKLERDMVIAKHRRYYPYW